MECITLAVQAANRKFFRNLFGLSMVALTLLHPVVAQSLNTSWPQLRIPQGIDTFDVGQELVVNGTPATVKGFVSQLPPAALVPAFRQMLGQPLMEDVHGSSLILGRSEGRYYITVQLDPSGSGTRGVIAVTRPPDTTHASGDISATRRIIAGLPPGSTLTSHTSFVDAGVRAEHDAVFNSHSIEINREYVQRMLRADGFILEHEAGPSANTHLPQKVRADSRTFFFKRPGAEAIAVLFTDESGKSVIVLNRLNFQRRAE
jgi:hypothetical protein